MYRPLIPTVAIVSLGAAAAAQDGCATAADLARGVTLDFDDATSEVYRAAGPGIQTVEGRDDAGAYYGLRIAQGTHLLEYFDIVDGQPDAGSRQEYDYGTAPADLPVPTPGGRFSAEVTVAASDGVRTEAQTQAYVAGEPLAVGGCTYDTVQAVIAYDTTDNYIESVSYLPELGIGYLVWNESDGVRSEDTIVTAIRTGK